MFIVSFTKLKSIQVVSIQRMRFFKSAIVYGNELIGLHVPPRDAVVCRHGMHKRSLINCHWKMMPVLHCFTGRGLHTAAAAINITITEHHLQFQEYSNVVRHLSLFTCTSLMTLYRWPRILIFS
jgi:hypothetical protein